jgi:ribosomal protein L37AE/L43A
MAAGSDRVKQRAWACPSCVATYNRGGYAAHTLAFSVAHVHAVPLSSDSKSLAFGCRLRW